MLVKSANLQDGLSRARAPPASDCIRWGSLRLDRPYPATTEWRTAIPMASTVLPLLRRSSDSSTSRHGTALLLRCVALLLILVLAACWLAAGPPSRRRSTPSGETALPARTPCRASAKFTTARSPRPALSPPATNDCKSTTSELQRQREIPFQAVEEDQLRREKRRDGEGVEVQGDGRRQKDVHRAELSAASIYTPSPSKTGGRSWAGCR